MKKPKNNKLSAEDQLAIELKKFNDRLIKRTDKALKLLEDGESSNEELKKVLEKIKKDIECNK